MEFKFNVNDVFKEPIVEINHSLVPKGFTGDRRTLCDTITKVSEVVNALGDSSASAQGLSKPITTAERLRNSNQSVFLMVDKNAKNGKGAVTGMLKTGKKGLYVFDRDGHHYQVSPPCVLDFYIHESKQRMGLGRQLFEHMLEKQELHPAKLAIDRPSDKFLSFLRKHYSLSSPVRQMNNYVVFDGFFPEKQNQANGDVNPSPSRTKQSANGLQPNYTSPYGRFGAPRPPCSMGQIIHNQTSVVPNSDSTGLNVRGNVFNPASYRSNYTVPKPIPNYSNVDPRTTFSAPNFPNQFGQTSIPVQSQPMPPNYNNPVNVHSSPQFANGQPATVNANQEHVHHNHPVQYQHPETTNSTPGIQQSVTPSQPQINMNMAQSNSNIPHVHYHQHPGTTTASVVNPQMVPQYSAPHIPANAQTFASPQSNYVPANPQTGQYNQTQTVHDQQSYVQQNYANVQDGERQQTVSYPQPTSPSHSPQTPVHAPNQFHQQAGDTLRYYQPAGDAPNSSPGQFQAQTAQVHNAPGINYQQAQTQAQPQHTCTHMSPQAISEPTMSSIGQQQPYQYSTEQQHEHYHQHTPRQSTTNVGQQPYQYYNNTAGATQTPMNTMPVYQEQVNRPDASGDMPPVRTNSKEYGAHDPDIYANPEMATSQEYPPQIRHNNVAQVQDSPSPYPNPTGEVYSPQDFGHSRPQIASQ